MKKTGFKLLPGICLLSVFLVQPLFLNGQSDQNRFWPHVRYGGGVGLSFGDGYFSGTLAPSAIYQFNSQFAAGLALNGTYANLKNRYSATILGGSIISLYNIISEIQLSAEFEQLNVNRKYELDNHREKYWNPALFLGVGFRAHSITLGVRYDVLFDSDKSVYANAFSPFVRIYF